jgi:non-homologous end joining protein Ku
MMATVRNTTITWGLASFPVAVAPIETKQETTFDYAVIGPSGLEPRAQRFVGALSGVQATDENTVQGVWLSDDTFHEIPANEIAAAKATGVIEGVEIEEFAPLRHLPVDRIKGGYYLVPQKGMLGAKPLKLLRDAMKAEKVFATAKINLRGETGRQKLVAIYEDHDKVVMSVLAFAEKVRFPSEIVPLREIDTPAPVKRAARDLVKAMSKPEPVMLNVERDDVLVARERLYSDAVDGATPVKPKVSTPPVDDLMGKLIASLEVARG